MPRNWTSSRTSGARPSHRGGCGCTCGCTPPRFDERLADGANPLSSQPLALRARQLAEARTRHSLAVAIDTLVQDAHRPAPNVRATVRFDEATVRTVVTDLRALAERLRDRRPVAERGVAMTSVLLRDGCGPVYDRHAPLPLSYSVRIARLCLDP